MNEQQTTEQPLATEPQPVTETEPELAPITWAEDGSAWDSFEWGPEEVSQ